jgi:hypothetical protein
MDLNNLDAALARRRVRQLADLVRRHGGRMTVRELQRANGKWYRTVADAERALGELVRAGLAKWVLLPNISSRYVNKVVSAVQLCNLSDSDHAVGVEQADGREATAKDNCAPPPAAR